VPPLQQEDLEFPPPKRCAEATGAEFEENLHGLIEEMQGPSRSSRGGQSSSTSLDLQVLRRPLHLKWARAPPGKSEPRAKRRAKKTMRPIPVPAPQRKVAETAPLPTIAEEVTSAADEPHAQGSLPQAPPSTEGDFAFRALLPPLPPHPQPELPPPPPPLPVLPLSPRPQLRGRTRNGAAKSLPAPLSFAALRQAADSSGSTGDEQSRDARGDSNDEEGGGENAVLDEGSRASAEEEGAFALAPPPRLKRPRQD
jgi:hypothetical protein